MRVLLTGATSQIGGFLLPRLRAAGHEAIAVSRRQMPERQGLRWLTADLAAGSCSWPAAEALIHIAPLRLLPGLLPAVIAAGCRRVICFGTTGRYSKAASANPHEQDVVKSQVAAEAEVAAICERLGADWTLFRPTLIYGSGMDLNVTLIAKVIRRFGVFPLFGQAAGRRQPVHADDLAAACVAVLTEPRSFNRAYDLSGGETLTYREMVERIFVGAGRRPRFVQLPMGLFVALMWCVSRLPRFKDFNAEMVRRMNEDLVFDSSPAARDFAYSPRAFAPDK